MCVDLQRFGGIAESTWRGRRTVVGRKIGGKVEFFKFCTCQSGTVRWDIFAFRLEHGKLKRASWEFGRTRNTHSRGRIVE